MSEKVRKNLAKIRKSKGFTQRELAKKTGFTQRMIAYYEKEAVQIPSDNLKKLATILKVTTDELLGLKKIKDDITLEESKILKKVKKINKLPRKDQKVIFNLINSLSAKQK